MKRSIDRILTTHTGSLPLPALVRQALAAKRRGEAYDQAVIDSTLATAIGAAVRRQIEVGIDIVNDGELSKPRGMIMSCTASAVWKENRAHGHTALNRGALPKGLSGRAIADSCDATSKARRATTAPTSPSFTNWRAPRATFTITAAWLMSVPVP